MIATFDYLQGDTTPLQNFLHIFRTSHSVVPKLSKRSITKNRRPCCIFVVKNAIAKVLYI